MTPQWFHDLVVGLEPLQFWFLFAALAGGAPFLLYRGSQAFWRLRTITNTPTACIQSAPQGYVELSGLACPHLSHVLGPLTGRPCVCYRYRIEERCNGRNKEWHRSRAASLPDPSCSMTAADSASSTRPVLMSACARRTDGSAPTAARAA